VAADVVAFKNGEIVFHKTKGFTQRRRGAKTDGFNRLQFVTGSLLRRRKGLNW